MILNWLLLVSVFLGLMGICIWILNIFSINSIIRDIAHNTRCFCKNCDKLTDEAIKNITWNEHDRLFWVVTSTWLLSMILGASIASLLIEIFS